MTALALRDAFVLTYDRMRRYDGSWHTERQPLFPDYVFLESADAKQFVREMKQYQDVFQILGDDDGPIPVAPEEERFLRNLCGPDHHSKMSRGYILNGETHVTEGPLRGKESLIRRIDRHKRLARLEMPERMLQIFLEKGRIREMNVGLEIVAKS